MLQTSSSVAPPSPFDWKARLRAAGVHLGLSALVASLAAVLVFALWYPFPYREISGGRDLFQLLVLVDVVVGPLITLAVFNRAKPRAELRRDLAVVAVLQLAALGYGLWTVHLARPVHLVFEYDRFRVVHQSDVPEELADRVPAGLELAPWGAPTLLSLRPFRDSRESFDMTMEAVQGVSLAARPELWQTYEAGREQVLGAAKPVSALLARFPERAPEIQAALQRAGRTGEQTVFVPLIARKATAWTVLLDARTAGIVAYVPVDSF